MGGKHENKSRFPWCVAWRLLKLSHLEDGNYRYCHPQNSTGGALSRALCHSFCSSSCIRRKRNPLFILAITEDSQSAAGAAGLGIIRSKKIDNVEFAL